MKKASVPKIRTTALGDGYEFRALSGIPFSQDPKVFDLTFNVSETDADVIEAFLRSRVADQASFTFTPPAEGFSAKTGTYVQSNGSGAAGTIITVTFANHGVAIGDVLTVDFVNPKSVIVWVIFAVASLAVSCVLLPGPYLIIFSCPQFAVTSRDGK